MAGPITKQVKANGGYFVRWGKFQSIVVCGRKGRMYQRHKRLFAGQGHKIVFLKNPSPMDVHWFRRDTKPESML